VQGGRILNVQVGHFHILYKSSVAEVKQHWSVIRWVTKNLLSQVVIKSLSSSITQL
jgi:hypothetical protein